MAFLGLSHFWAGPLDGRSQIVLLTTSLCDVGSFGLAGYFYLTSLFVPATFPARSIGSGWSVCRPNVCALSASLFCGRSLQNFSMNGMHFWIQELMGHSMSFYFLLIGLSMSFFGFKCWCLDCIEPLAALREFPIWRALRQTAGASHRWATGQRRYGPAQLRRQQPQLASRFWDEPGFVSLTSFLFFVFVFLFLFLFLLSFTFLFSISFPFFFLRSFYLS